MKKIKQVFPSRNYITIDSFGDVEVVFNPVGDGFEGDDKLLFRKGRWAFRVNDFLAGKTMPDGSKEGMGRKVYSLNLVYNEEDGEPIVNTTYVDPTSVIPLDGSIVDVVGSEKLAQEETLQTLAKESTVQTLARDETVQTLAKESTVQTLARDETVQTLAKESTVQTLAKEETLQTLAKESTVQTILEKYKERFRPRSMYNEVKDSWKHYSAGTQFEFKNHRYITLQSDCLCFIENKLMTLIGDMKEFYNSTVHTLSGVQYTSDELLNIHS